MKDNFNSCKIPIHVRQNSESNQALIVYQYLPLTVQSSTCAVVLSCANRIILFSDAENQSLIFSSVVLFPTEIEAKGKTDRLETKAVPDILKNTDTEQIYRNFSSLDTSGLTALWLPESHAENIEICDGDSVRVTTKHDSPFIGQYRLFHLEVCTV